ncbi:MAG: phosphonate ABC transporter, permease protein PhnE [Chloroflexota bacterium]
MNRRALVYRLGLLLFVSALGYTLANVELLDAGKLQRGTHNTLLFARGLLPPDWSVLPTVTAALGETVQIAFAGTALGFLLALPTALAASPMVAGRKAAAATRLLLALIRTVPALLWAIVFVVAIGLGPAAGTLGVAMYTLGYLGKLYAEAFEGVDPEVVEAVRGTGIGRLQLARYAIIPEAVNSIVSQLLFMFEYNVRASSILGFVGAGGIGYYLMGYLQTLRYDSLTTALLVTLTVVVAIDRASAALRARLLLSPTGPGQ